MIFVVGNFMLLGVTVGLFVATLTLDKKRS